MVPGRLGGMPGEARDLEAAHRESVRQAIDRLRRAGARFVFMHGSQVSGSASAESDVDLAAYFGDRPAELPSLIADMPRHVDLLVLDTAPLELAGRVATYGHLLWEADPAERVHWQAQTRKIWFDEKPRIEQARRDFVAAQRRRLADG